MGDHSKPQNAPFDTSAGNRSNNEVPRTYAGDGFEHMSK